MLKKFFKKKQTCESEEIANLGLHLAMAFGKNWQVPIQSRLAKQCASLSENELNGYNLLCNAAMKFGHETVYRLAKKHGKDTCIDEFKSFFLDAYPWVSDENVKALFNQGMYYAEKELAFS